MTNELTLYSARAAIYDTSTGGSYARLGHDLVEWTAPARGAAVRDLAYGTGLVAVPVIAAVSPAGVVVGIDGIEPMLDIGREKTVRDGCTPIKWLVGDIEGDIGKGEEIKE